MEIYWDNETDDDPFATDDTVDYVPSENSSVTDNDDDVEMDYETVEANSNSTCRDSIGQNRNTKKKQN